MKESKIDFYDTFSCIAGECSITCCQEWKIEIDEETLSKWSAFQKQCEESLIEKVEERDGNKIMKLDEDKKCPYLTEQKLCKLVNKFGEESISKTCKVFPRIVHEFSDRKEYSLTSCCPEVVDCLRRREQITLIKEGNRESISLLEEIRRNLVGIMQEKKISVTNGFMIGFYMLLSFLEEKKLNKKSIKVYRKQEILNELQGIIGEMEFHQLDTFDECNELLLDICDNYRKQNLYTAYLETIVKKAEDLLEGYEENWLEKKLKGFEKVLAGYEALIRNYITIEIYNTFLLPDSNLENLIIMLQWIGMEYAVIRQALFLKWLENDCEKLSYEEIRDYIVIISRMTGYDQEDIYEYLKDSFQSVIWEWGYFALMIGNCNF
ncbi:flagellin lysine-N-methylase [[Clostridium] polysaccharolyticum]|uniref:Lysine-N-methylase n=1 Tax=[Clostridium] polysaccharolyticum TaxID=29364 RepID=A0A1I0AIH8_9FIRM|nr:flagellin lysine-N-methylase [[Clostridium] polysaccharolyticum]SES94080.1 lysine-N-methylase [[Clostridium] polysaccharolyticum]